MSGFIGLISSLDTIVDKCDYRITSESYRPIAELRDVGPTTGDLTAGNPWWPRSGGMLGEARHVMREEAGWELPDITGGATYRWGVTGVTRDVHGSPLGGVTVKLYRTSTDEMVGSVVSDPSGNYFVTSPYYPDPHYLVTYKAGSPDVFGTSVNTLIGA